MGLGLDALANLDPAAWRPDPWLLTAASLVFLGGVLFSGLLWGQVVRDMGGTSLSHLQAVRIFLIANLGRYIPGKIWQVTGLAVLAKRRGVPGSLSSLSAVVAHGVSLCAAAVVGAMVFSTAFAGHPRSRIILGAGLVGLVLLAAMPPVLRLGTRLLTRLGIDLAGITLSPWVVLRWLALFVVHWVIYGASFLLLARSFGLPGDAVEVIAAYVAAYVLGYVAVFAPAGLGVREASLLAFLAPAMGQAPAAGLAVIARLWSTIIEVIPAGAMWGMELARGHTPVTRVPDADPGENP